MSLVVVVTGCSVRREDALRHTDAKSYLRTAASAANCARALPRYRLVSTILIIFEFGLSQKGARVFATARRLEAMKDLSGNRVFSAMGGLN